MSDSANSGKIALLTGSIEKTKKLLSDGQIAAAQQSLIRAKGIFEKLNLEGQQREMMNYELQELRADIELAMLGS